jgi:hypothetical protein
MKEISAPGHATSRSASIPTPDITWFASPKDLRRMTASRGTAVMTTACLKSIAFESRRSCSAWRPWASETDRQGTGHGDRRAFPRAPITRSVAGSRAARGVVHEPSGGRELCGAPASTRHIEQCEPDRNPRSDRKTRIVDHGDRDNASWGVLQSRPACGMAGRLGSAGMSVRYEVRGHVAVLTIDRPEARNAVNGDVARGIEDGLDRAEAAGGGRRARRDPHRRPARLLRGRGPEGHRRG